MPSMFGSTTKDIKSTRRLSILGIMVEYRQFKQYNNQGFVLKKLRKDVEYARIYLRCRINTKIIDSLALFETEKTETMLTTLQHN